MHKLATAVPVGLLVLVSSAAARAQVVINEVDYDQPSADTAEFIELRNNGATAVSLSGYAVQLVNGANNTTYQTITLPNAQLAAGDHFVICANTATVSNCDLDVNPNSDLVQNGAPDALALVLNGTAVDRLSYEGAVPGFTEGAAAGTDTGAAVESLSRCPDGVDTDQNSTDFALRPSTPGVANDCAPVTPGDLGACGDAATKLSTVQGTGASSPLGGSTVVVEGIVVADYQDDDLNGFFVQEEDADRDSDVLTSEGIFVAEGSLAVSVSVGQRVRVRGTVVEVSSQTQLTAPTGALVCPTAGVASSTNLTLPVNAVSDLERYEGMLVNISQTLTVTSNFEWGRFGSLDLSVNGRLYQPTNVVEPGAAAAARQDLNDRSRIILDDLSNVQNPSPIPYKDANNTRRLGDTLASLTGVLSGAFGAYRVHPTVTPVFSGQNPRPAAPNPVGGRLRVASFNVLNYFTTLDTGAAVCGPTGGLDCRGANTAAEFTRQRTKLLNALQTLNADVVGLIEIQNDASASTQDIVNGLNDRLGAGTYAFVNTGTIGTDAIKQALIYKPAKVSPTGNFALLTTAIDPEFIDTKNRPALAQTFSEVSTLGRLTVVVNHLKSKGSACTDVGDPDLNDGQANCNVTRTRAAAALLRWVATDPTNSSDPDFIIMGDLNAYAKEDPIDTIKAGGYTALIETLVGPSAYSYQFGGQSGYLDHALSSASLTPQVTGATEWHLNSDEPVVINYNTEFKTDDPYSAADPFGASDHDAVVVGLNLTPLAPAPVPASDDLLRGCLLVLLLGLVARASYPVTKA